MDLHRLGIAAVSTLLLVTTFYKMPQSSAMFQTKQVQSTQITTLQIDTASLKRPCWLSIKTNSASLKGQITLNGKVIHSLANTNTRFNLAPYLKVSKNTLAISGNYSPLDASIIIELNAQDTHIKQQTGGNGLLNQLLILEVK